MASETRFFCDFNPNVKKHDAAFHLTVQGQTEAEELRAGGVDTCEKHLCKMMFDLYRKGAHTVVVKLREGETLTAKRVAGEGEYECAYNLCDRKFGSLQAATVHYNRTHKKGLAANG